jgi:hypothetical protein
MKTRSLLFSLCLLLPASAPAADWPDARIVGPIICRADFPLSGIEGELRDLTRLQKDLTDALGIPAAKEPIELYLFHDRDTYARYLKRYLPSVPFRKAIYVKGQGPGRVFAYWSRQLEVDLRHEYAHALLHASLPMVPLWLDEGLASYFEVPAPRRAFDHPHLASVQRSARLGWTPRIEALEKKADLKDMGAAEYRDSWAWVHFMLHGSAGAREELAAFLADIHGSNPPGVLSNRLRRRVPDVQRRFAEHFCKAHFP